ncbi:MAG TPA: efflux RND transporter periplasmic adaptor subunit [Chthoniobacteraceae bacterium]|jgi:RND family efflux transporter MFP subunit
MNAANDRQSSAPSEAFAQLDRLRLFAGAPGEFWPAFLQIALSVAGAEEAVLLTRQRAADEPAVWKDAFCWPPTSTLFSQLKAVKGELERLGLEAEGNGSSVSTRSDFVAVRLETGETQRGTVLVARVVAGGYREEAATRLRLLADAPLLYQLTRTLEQARHDAGRFAVTLDLLTLLNAQTRLAAAAMLLCNEVAARFRCDRVSLGWLERKYLRLQAISHSEKFEKKMAIVAALERTMEEALEQDEELIFPAPPESRAVTRDHAAFAREQGSANLLSLPLRISAEPTGVLLLERGTEFTGQELQTLRLLCDQSARRLYDLKRHDRWFGARFATWLREQAARIVGPEHTGRKVLALTIAVLLAVLLFGKAEYRVEAPFILKSDALAQVPAPFDGFLDEVHFRIGDAVVAGQPLFSLDPRELVLQEAAALAERQRFFSEAQNAESLNDAAEMRIAQASADEAQARLDLARHHLGKAKVPAPFDGYVVEGDLREKIASPLKQGEVLVKVAKLDAIYAEVAMPERDVHEIRHGQGGEIAFASRPQFTYPVKVERVEPVAEIREKGNVFIVRSELTAAHEPWWRPGMSGVCKISVGQRNLLWIISHRTVDFLRLYLWW